MLLLDQTDVYGSDAASFTLAGLLGSRDPELNPSLPAAGAAAGQDAARAAGALPGCMRLVPIPAPCLPISGVQTWECSGPDAPSIGNARGYILDLAPKVRQA